MILRPLFLVIHFIGVFMIFLSLGGVILRSINGLGREHNFRVPVTVTHGIGLVLAFVGGFGMLHSMHLPNLFPGWIVGKIVIWIGFGGLMTLALRKPGMARSLWWGMLIMGTCAAMLGAFKPF